MIIDEDGNQAPIRDEIIKTINNLSPEIENLKLSSNMDRIITRLRSGHAYYKDQIKIYNKNNDIKDVIISDVEKLKN